MINNLRIPFLIQLDEGISNHIIIMGHFGYSYICQGPQKTILWTVSETFISLA
jgi:hypothetical protein